jgi:hypothetical protein
MKGVARGTMATTHQWDAKVRVHGPQVVHGVDADDRNDKEAHELHAVLQQRMRLSLVTRSWPAGWSPATIPDCAGQ